MNISQMIAKLRRERGMTQEALAEEIGVSPQTISKWETATTLPDVMLLPLLADVFDVTTDTLYGRKPMKPSTSPDKIVDQMADAASRIIVNAFGNGSDEEQAKHRREMQREPKWRSGMQVSQGIMYYREERGVLALRSPKDGWHILFEDEKAAALLTLLADADFRKAMSTILTRTYLMRTAEITDGEHLDQCLTQSGLFARQEVLVDDAPLSFWEFQYGRPELSVLYAVLAWAQEFARYESNHYYYSGNGACLLS